MTAPAAPRLARLGEWSGRRVALVSVAWILGAPLLAALGLILAGALLGAVPSKEHIDISISLTSLGIGTSILLPPVLLVAAWLWRRDRRAPRRLTGMRVATLAGMPLAPVLAYDAERMESAEWASGGGDSHVHVVRFAPGGSIAAHPTGSAQLFVPVEGAGWVSDVSGRRVPLGVGEVALFARGETHAKGSDAGMLALMIQIHDLALVTPGTDE